SGQSAASRRRAGRADGCDGGVERKARTQRRHVGIGSEFSDTVGWHSSTEGRCSRDGPGVAPPFSLARNLPWTAVLEAARCTTELATPPVINNITDVS